MTGTFQLFQRCCGKCYVYNIMCATAEFLVFRKLQCARLFENINCAERAVVEVELATEQFCSANVAMLLP